MNILDFFKTKVPCELDELTYFTILDVLPHMRAVINYIMQHQRCVASTKIALAQALVDWCMTDPGLLTSDQWLERKMDEAVVCKFLDLNNLVK